jgi:ribonuclease BN (tRNA processing enzyme)
MNFIFLGTGSAFAKQNFNSNAILEVNGKRLLIDAGTDIRWSLDKAGINLTDIDAVYVTHNHADHWAGAEFLAYGSYFNPAFVKDGVRRRFKLFAHSSVRSLLWGTMKDSTVLPNKKAELTDYFDVVEFTGESFTWEGVEFNVVKVIHCLDNGEAMPCYGLTWKTPSGKTVWYSADAILDRDQKLFDTADVIFHDCETAPFKTGVHAHYSELATLSSEQRSKITLYHYNDGPRKDAVADGFNGFAVQGATIPLA